MKIWKQLCEEMKEPGKQQEIFRAGCQENLLQRSGWALGQSAQGGTGVRFPGGVWETLRCGAEDDEWCGTRFFRIVSERHFT